MTENSGLPYIFLVIKIAGNTIHKLANKEN